MKDEERIDCINYLLKNLYKIKYSNNEKRVIINCNVKRLHGGRLECAKRIVRGFPHL